MTKDDVVQVVKGFKAAANERVAQKMPPRKGDMHPSFVVGDKAIIVSVPWSLVQQKSEAEISAYIMDKLK